MASDPQIHLRSFALLFVFPHLCASVIFLSWRRAAWWPQTAGVEPDRQPPNDKKNRGIKNATYSHAESCSIWVCDLSLTVPPQCRSCWHLMRTYARRRWARTHLQQCLCSCILAAHRRDWLRPSNAELPPLWHESSWPVTPPTRYPWAQCPLHPLRPPAVLHNVHASSSRKAALKWNKSKIKLTQNAKQIVRKLRASPSAKDTPRPLQPLASPVPAAC